MSVTSVFDFYRYMNLYEEVMGALEGRPRWQLVTFAAGCAERLAPVVHALRGPGRAEVLEPGLALAWAATEDQAPTPDMQRVLAAFDPVEAAVPNSTAVPEHTAIRTLALVTYALRAAIGADPVHAAREACREAVQITGNFDAVLTHPPGEPVITDWDDIPAPGTLQTAETAAQVQTLALIDNPALSQREAVAAVRRLARPLADGVDAVLPEILRREGW